MARQLIGVGYEGKPAFGSIIVITDRRVLDRQIDGTIRQFTQVASTVGHADRSGDLRRFIEEGKKIIITTVQKFPFILDDIGNDHRDRRFAIIIDEAHSSQGGKAAGAVNRALGEGSVDDEEDQDTFEDQVNRIIESRRMLTNASYLAFTATPKNKTHPLHHITAQSRLTASPFKPLLDHLNHLGRHAGVFVHHQVSQPPVQFRRDSTMQHSNIRCRGLFTEGLPPLLVIR